MEREELKQLMSELLAELIGEAEEPVLTELNTGLTGAACVLENIGAVIRAADDELEEANYTISTSVAYSLMASLLDMGLLWGWLDEESQWRQIIELFNNRSDEFVGELNGYSFGDLDFKPEKVTQIADYILFNWRQKAKFHSEDGEFTPAEKVFMIRSILIGLRNGGHLSYDPWLKTLLAALRTDWQVLGGGFGSNMGGGPGGWSYGG